MVISPPRYRPEIERAIRATTWNTPTLISSLICAWIEDGTVARFETQKRQDARQRQQVAREVLCGASRRQSSRFVLRLAAAG
ncbi:GntR family transcriptional regulator domain / Aspartate aminotransferase [Klebsiella pneumoniae subsp. ozaenae]|uniref:GntR family transcriptional regulator domain / Aspartate aminotransferase n=1 Tax=Klebsiella pneumoniae subsp. ozaenae TaxID=574 RepID=A0A377Z5L7_KLEPO|nr:GntR family transcriptional regulator domain / Aspartate aminotransferase [Klebsiella pneumoniae subsp. ozaenae]